MLKIVLADDESLIREGFAELIEWNKSGFEVIATVEDGEQALEVLEKTQVDVLFSDIRMPFLDGLQLAKHVNENFPETYIIFISGYDEFEYAREAVKIGAFDYILKPINIENIYEVLEKIKKDYFQKTNEKRIINQLNKQMKMNKPLIEQDFVRRLLNGKVNNKNFKTEIDSLNINIPDSNVCVLIIQIDDYYSEMADFDMEEIAVVQEKFEFIVKSYADNEIILHDRENEFVIAIFDRIDNICEKCRKIGRELISAFDEFPVTVASGACYKGVENTCKSYYSARRVLAYKFISKGKRYISFEEINEMQQNIAGKQISVDYSFITKCIKDCRKAEIEDYLRELQIQLEKKGSGSGLFAHLIIGNIFMYVIAMAEHNIGSVEKAFPDPMERFSSIFKHDTLDMMIEELCGILFNLIDYIKTSKEISIEAIVRRTEQYIKDNYFRSDLTLAEVAETANMSPNYFSMIFKQITGTTYSNYLMELRLTRAKELLEITDKLIYEISDEVGYDTTTYFSTVFRRKFGVSPVYYRKNNNLRSERLQ